MRRDNILGGGGNSGACRPGETWGDPPGIQLSAECYSLTGRLILWSNTHHSHHSNTSSVHSFLAQQFSGEIGEMSAWCWWWWFTLWRWSQTAGPAGLINHHYNSSSLLAPLSSPDMKSSVGVWPNKMTKPGIWWPGQARPG